MPAATNKPVWWLALIALAGAAAAFGAWGIAAFGSVDRFDKDDLDEIAGPLDPSASALESHLAWTAAILNGADFDAEEVAARFSDNMAAAVPFHEFAGLVNHLRTEGPFEFNGYATFFNQCQLGQIVLDSAVADPVVVTASTCDDPRTESTSWSSSRSAQTSPRSARSTARPWPLDTGPDW